MKDAGSEASLNRPVGGQIDFFELVQIATARWKWAFSVSLLIGVLTFTYIAFFVPLYFKSRGVVMIPLKDSSSSSIGGLSQALSQIRGASGSDEILQYETILRTEQVKNKIMSQFGLKDLQFSTKSSGSTLGVEATHTQPEMAKNIVLALLSELELSLQNIAAKKAESNQKFFEARLKEAENSMVALEKKLNELRVNQGQREYAIQSKILGLLREQFEIAQIEAKKEQRNFVLIDPPQVPTEKAGPHKAKSGLTAMLASFFVLLFGLIVIELFRREYAVRYHPSRSPLKSKSEPSAWVN